MGAEGAPRINNSHTSESWINLVLFGDAECRFCDADAFCIAQWKTRVEGREGKLARRQ